MPIISNQHYQPPWWAKSAHLNTVLPNRLRFLRHIQYERFTIDTPDGDFLDIDSSTGTNRKEAAILIHGLEGSAQSTYMKGMTETLSDSMDVFCLNLRSCSGRPNNTVQSYHSGKTDDLATLVAHLIEEGEYESIHLVGFSLGANLILLWCGEMGHQLPSEVKSAVAVSAPCDLRTSVDCLHKRQNIVYLQRFMRTMKVKIQQKEPLLKKEGIRVDFHTINSFHDFDNQYTAPAHGFDSALDYYEKCSSRYVLNEIQIPALIINAQDDTFLSPDCYPYSICESHDQVHLLTPQFGGHVGFATSSRLREKHWHEEMVQKFIAASLQSNLPQYKSMPAKS